MENEIINGLITKIIDGEYKAATVPKKMFMDTFNYDDHNVSTEEALIVARLMAGTKGIDITFDGDVFKFIRKH